MHVVVCTHAVIVRRCSDIWRGGANELTDRIIQAGCFFGVYVALTSGAVVPLRAWRVGIRTAIVYCRRIGHPWVTTMVSIVLVAR
jgi:hypothetical protein